MALMALGGALGPVLVARDAAWQAWQMVTSTFVSRGRRGTISHSPWFCVAGVALMALGGALGPVFVARDAAALCVAGVALGDIHLRFTWQAWHHLTFTLVLRGRHGTHGTHGTGWRAWARFSRAWRRGTLRGRRGTWWHLRSFHVAGVAHRGTISHPPSFCVAGVALMVLGGALGPVLVARDAAALCVAGVALGDIYVRFTWQAWHHLTFTLVLRGRRGTHGTGWRAWARSSRAWRRGTLRGRRGTWWHPPSFHVAGVAPSHIHLRFAWQAWHSWLWQTLLGTSTHFVTHGIFAWQTWHLGHTQLRVTHQAFTHHLSHPPSFCVAGVAPSLTHHLSHTTSSHTIFHRPSFTHQLCHTPSLTHPLLHTIFVTHHLSHSIFYTQLCHTHHLWHTTVVTHHLCHTPLCHTPSLYHTIFHTPSFTTPSLSHINFVTHHLSPHHLCHTPLCHTPSFTHNFVTRSLSHTTFTHTIFHTLLCHTHTHKIFLHHTPSFTFHFVTHTTVLTSRSFTASFPFLSFQVLATTFDAHYWKKLTCGVIRSFNCSNVEWSDALTHRAVREIAPKIHDPWCSMTRNN